MRIKRNNLRIVLIVSIILVGSWTLGVKLAYAAVNWQENPNSCPAADESNFPGQSCPGSLLICGDDSGTSQCYDMSTMVAPGSDSAASNTQYNGLTNGGYVVDCYTAVDGGSPYCDNSGNFWCNRDPQCVTWHRNTICKASTFAYQANSYECSGSCHTDYHDCDADNQSCEIHDGDSCGISSQGDYLGCSGASGACTCRYDSVSGTGTSGSTSDHFDCDSSTATVGNGCESQYHGTASCGGHAWTTYCSGGSGVCGCQSGNIDFDDNDGDADIDTGGSGNGCEIVTGEACTMTVGGVAGTCAGTNTSTTGTADSDGDPCECIGEKSYFETGTLSAYATGDALLWGRQFGSGALITFGNSTTADLFVVNNDGSVSLGQIAEPAVTTDKLYNVGGSLYWNGTLVGAGSGGGFWEDGTNGVFEDDKGVIVGIDQVETLENAGFVLDIGDMFVQDQLGVEGNVYTDGAFVVGATTTLSDGSLVRSDSGDGNLTISTAGGTDGTLRLQPYNDMVIMQDFTVGHGGWIDNTNPTIATAGLAIDPNGLDPVLGGMGYVMLGNYTGSTLGAGLQEFVAIDAANSNPMSTSPTRRAFIGAYENNDSDDVLINLFATNTSGIGSAAILFQTNGAVIEMLGGQVRFADVNDSLHLSQTGSSMGDDFLNGGGEIYSATGTIGSTIGVGETSTSLIHALNAVGTYVVNNTGASTFLALTDTPAVYTEGSLLFTSGSEVTEDNANLFWDDTTNRLGIGTNTPGELLHVATDSPTPRTIMSENTTDGSSIAFGHDDFGFDSMIVDQNDNVLLGVDTMGNVGIKANAVVIGDGRLSLRPSGGGVTRPIVFNEIVANGTNYVGFKAPDSIVADLVWTLPNADGTSGQVLQTDGSGALSWNTASGDNIYTADGTLTGARVVDANGFGLNFHNGFIDYEINDDASAIIADDVSSRSRFDIEPWFFQMYAQNNTTFQAAMIVGNNSGTLTLRGNTVGGVGNETSLALQSNLFEISMDNTTFQGATYDKDYSANFVDRSLVDKGYVDGAITTGGPWSRTGTLLSTTTGGDNVTIDDGAMLMFDGGAVERVIYVNAGVFTIQNSNGDMIIDQQDGALEIVADAGLSLATKDKTGAIGTTALNIETGSVVDGTSGNINLIPGVASGTGTQGSIRFANAYSFPNVDGTNNQVLATDGSGALSWISTGSGATSLWDTDGDTGIQVEETGDEDMIRFDTLGSERMIIGSNGNVAIGTSNTTMGNLIVSSGDQIMTSVGDLVIGIEGDGYDTFLETRSGDMAEGLVMHGGATGDAGIVKNMSSNGYASGWVANALHIFTSDTSPIISNINGSEVMRLTSDDRVGIGTTTPAVPLHIVSNQALNPHQVVRIQNGPGSYFDLVSIDEAPTAGYPAPLGSLAVVGTHLWIKTGTLDDAWTEIASGGTSAWRQHGNMFSQGGVFGTNDNHVLDIRTNGVTRIHLANATGSGAITFNSAYTFPTVDGTSGQVLQTNGGGALSWGSSSATALWDGDSDTGIQVEETGDEDIIRFDTLGVERMFINASGELHWMDNGYVSAYFNIDNPSDLPGSDPSMAGLAFDSVNDRTWIMGGEVHVANNLTVGTTNRDGNFHVKSIGAGNTSAIIEANGVANDAVLSFYNGDGGLSEGGGIVYDGGTNEFIMRTGGYAVNTDIVFQTNSLERMRIVATGAIRFNDAYTFPTADGTSGQALITDGSGALSWTNVGGETSMWDGDSDTGIQVEETGDEDFIRFDTNSSERMVITDTGQIGVGTATPSGSRIMHLYGVADTNNFGLEIQNDWTIDGNADLWLSAGPTSRGGLSLGSGHMTLTTYNALPLRLGTNATERMEIAATGAIQFNDAYTFPMVDGTNGQVLQTDGSGALSWASAGAGVSSIWDADTDTGIQVEEIGDEDIIRFDAGGTERMIIDSDGLVTIGGSGTTTGVGMSLEGDSNGVDIDTEFRITTGSTVPMPATASVFLDVGVNQGILRINKVEQEFFMDAVGTNSLIFKLDGTAVMRIDDSTGNVGINAVSPDADLDIEAAENTEFLRLTDSTNSDSVGFFTGNATPEGVVTAQLGSLFMDSAGGTLYLKDTGDGTNTGWVQVATGSTISNIYTVDGTLTGDRTLNTGGNSLTLQGTQYANIQLTFDDKVYFENYYSNVSMDDTNWNMHIEQGGGGTSTDFNIGNEITTITSSYGSFAGFQYGADYSANFVDRSLVDKGYVDNAIITGSNNIYTDNGTLSGDRVVDLGANFLTISDAGLSVNYGSRAAEILTQDWVGGTAQFIQNQASLLYSIRDGNGSDRTRTNFTSTSIEMGMSDDDFVTETNLIATAETIEIVSNRANFIGAIYDADYSANFTDRSLVDKAYVDGIVNNVPANNGLTNDSGTIQLGGALVENTQVTGDYTLRFDSTDTSSVSAAVNLNMGDARLSAAALGNTINHFRATQSSVEMLSDDNQGGSGTGISSITLDASTFGTVRTDSDLGLRYSADYSANFTDRSLVDKEYVDGLSGVSTFLALTDTPAAYTAGSLLFTSGSEVTEDNGNLFWDDTTNRLGIGTSTPSSILHVQQNHNGASDFYFTNTDSGVNAMTRLLMQNDVGEGGFGLVSSNFGAPYTNRVLMLAESNLAGILLAAQDVTGNIVFHTGGMSERMRIDANGNVGMGTSSPDADLDIEAAENTEMLRLTDSTNSDSVGFFTGNATPEGVVTAQLGSLFMDSASGELYIKDTGDGTNSGWEQVSTGAGGAFSTILSTTSNSPGTLATDDFVFGSNQLADDGNSDHDYRMFFDKSEGSFRAGMVDGTQWDNVNVGNISTALGWNVIASGNYSTALGHLATASGTSSTAIGYSATASGDYSTALGMGTLASHQYSTALGRGTIASGDHAMVMGYGTTASGLSSTAMGIDSTASGNYSTALGYDTVASGMISTSIGQDSHAAGSYSFTGGRNMRATSGSATFIWGYSGSSQSFAPADNRFLIFPQGDSGMVGIGTTTPSTTLHVDSNAANTVAMLTLENSAGDFQVFRTDVTPEGAVTGSVGDLVVDSNNGNMYIKNSGSGTNTGWVQLATGSGGGGTLDQAYDSGGAGAGRQIVADTGAVEITVSDASNNVGLVVNQNDVTNNPNGVQINHSGTGYGLYITEDEVNTDNVIARFSNTQAAVASGNYLLVDTDGHGIVIGGTNALAGSRGTMASVDFNTSTYSQLVQQGSDYVFQTGGAFGALQNSLTIANDGNAVFATDADSTTNAYQFTNLGSGNSLVVNDESGDTTPFVVNADGRVGIGTPTPSTTLHVDSNGANTVALLTLENTAGDFQVFRGDATPEGAVTGSIGDLAIDGTGGDIYIKNTGSGNNTGWVQLATGSGGGGDYSDGGEAGGADRTLGNTDAYALSLITNNTERLKIESGGDIDISQTIKIDGEQTVYNAQAEDGFTGSLIYGDGGTNLSHSSGSEGYYNTFVGIGSGNATTTGYSNTATGYTSFYTNTTGYHNMANGSEALRYNSTGYANVASGYQSLLANTTGYYNVASGSQALRSNTIGVENTAVGSQALYTNVAAGRSTAIGYRAMYNANNRATAAETRNTAVGYTALRGSTTAANNTGTRNTAIGDSALYGNTAGYRNTALGEVALVSNTTGNNNTASGVQSLQLNTSGGYNVGIGYLALDANTTGSNNTALGYNADVSSSGLTNATAIGNGATVDASNKVRIGDSSVTVIEGQVAWSYPSDSRLKENVEESVLGLEFIMDLNPVTFNYTAQGQEGIEYTGLIAQEVEEALNGTEFSGLNKPQNEDDFYSLSYSTFVVPLINAVQEQQIEIEALGVLSDNEEFVALVERVDSHDSDIDILKSENDAMQEALCGLGVEIFCE